MSLDLLKERFGSGKSTDKKESDKQKLNEMFISKPVGDIKSFKAQYQDELVEKDRVIENLKKELESQWLTNQTAFNTKKLPGAIAKFFLSSQNAYLAVLTMNSAVPVGCTPL